MASTTNQNAQSSQDSSSNPTWTYPTRFCRICREDVPPTVTMYPPGLPPALQRPIVEYVNDDEYGRLIKPCLCRGGMRYIHELCLLRSRTENTRKGSMWKCHECGYMFNFQRLAIQRWLSSKYASGVLTIVVILILMFTLGFVADPILNLYADPYETLMGHEPLWNEISVSGPVAKGASWAQHFLKGFVSMGLVGLLKSYILSPFRWWNMRPGVLVSSRNTSTTGRDRSINIAWLAVAIGVASTFYFFYQWVQIIITKALQRVGNNIVNTQLSGDDDDIKPPPGWKPENTDINVQVSDDNEDQTTTTTSGSSKIDDSLGSFATLRQRPQARASTDDENVQSSAEHEPDKCGSVAGSLADDDDNKSTTNNSTVHDAISQGWSFADL